SSTTVHCTDNQLIFENLTSQISKLTIADEFLKIVRKKNVNIILLNEFTARLDDILFISDIEINLLFTQALLVNCYRFASTEESCDSSLVSTHNIIIINS